MTTVPKNESRTDRLREYAAAVQDAQHAVAALGGLVRGREARSWDRPEPPEVVFAATEVGGRALPAGVWVALRRDDPPAAVEAMIGISQRTFLVDSREELGEGYRLHTVDETRQLPEVEVLGAQLAAMLDIPVDVLAVLVEWGSDDPRTPREIDELLDRRFGPASRPDAEAASAAAAAPAAPAAPTPGLTMTVAEAADALQLTEAQTKALSTLVRRVGVTITCPSP